MNAKKSILFLFIFVIGNGIAQNKDPDKVEIITSDIDHFWDAFEVAEASNFEPEPFQKLYLDKGSKGVKGFMKNRIQNATYLAKIVGSNSSYYASIQQSTKSIAGMEDEIKTAMIKMKDLYPKAVFPPIYFVVGALSSGGTTAKGGLIIGVEMYGLTPETPTDSLNEWLKTVLKPVEDVPHIVAHELAHFQQKYDANNLLQACIKEGAADFIAEKISGKHINEHVHAFANPREKELWLEFKNRMHKKNIKGWLYSQVEGRPNDLGYWMGYQITKSYYDHSANKSQAIYDIMHIRNFDEFLTKSRYADKFR